MHVLDLPSPLKERLYQLQSPQFTELIRLRVPAKTQAGTSPGGQPIFSTSYSWHDFEVSERLIGKISYSLGKARYPNDSNIVNQVVQLDLELLNTDGVLAATQSGGILRPADIEQGEVWVYANIGVGNPIEVFKGRIEGRPTEKRGVTIIRALGYMFEAARKPVLYENYGTVSGTVQNAQSTSQLFFTQAARIDCLGYHFCAHHGIVKFDGSGRAVPNVSQNGDGVTLAKVDLANAIKPGQYRIEFRDARNYVIVCPDNGTYSGNISKDTEGGGITIRASDWIGTNGTGVTIEISVSWAAQGNPVCMAYNCIEKSLANNVGDLPGLISGLRIDTPAWEAAARRFSSFNVFVDATNASNDVWARKAGNPPLSWGELAQRILDHVLCTLTVNTDGAITIVMPYLDDRDIWPTTTQGEILAPGITIEGGEAHNLVNVTYGHEGSRGYNATIERDLRVNSFADTVELTVAMPYYKHPISKNSAIWVLETISRRCMARQYRVSMQLSPQHSLTLLPGDIMQMTSNTSPYLQQNCEVMEIRKSVGGASSVVLSPIQTAEGARAAICTAQMGDTSLF